VHLIVLNLHHCRHLPVVIMLTRRLRCLFSILTWPIVPLGTIVIVALLYFLYTAAFVRDDADCDHDEYDHDGPMMFDGGDSTDDDLVKENAVNDDPCGHNRR
jgi:hypothetical protein